MRTSHSQKLASLTKDLTKDYPRSPRDLLAGYVIAGRTLDKCRATLAGTAGEYHFDCPLDNFFFGFAEISGDEFKNFVATGASDKEVAEWIERKAKRRPRIEIIKRNNDWRYKRLSKMPDRIQEFMEDSGVSVLEELYEKMKAAPFAPDLGNLWQRLGVDRRGSDTVLNDSAPLAAIRKAITEPVDHPN